ncbi:MAG: radical SAM protein [Sandaracinus sp.]
MSARRTRVLLLWPGSIGASGGNFGVPQLVGLASFLKARTRAEVEIRDLVAERALRGGSPVDTLWWNDAGEPYDVVALSVYSSFDWLLSEELARRARAALPDAVIVAGGYHASARPAEIVRDGSPFDVGIVGEGELPLARVVASVEGGAPLRGEILGSEPIEDLDALPETDWSVLARYRGVARSVASQAQLYLSRGCPFDCAFCMERAKRDVRWRSYSVERAVHEVLSLHRFLDLRGWTLYVADALFGMKTSWRRAFLAELARHRVPVDKIWLLIRVDLVEDEDLPLFRDANCGLGFGLESGDPGQLAIIRKAGRLEGYLARMRDIAAWALAQDVPWGANVIVGHPGETEASLRTSAAYLRELFLGPRSTTGFLSVDAFRLYPGSPIDQERSAWEARYGTRFHRPAWWEDGDPAFLAEWVDPSSELDYLRREQLQAELFTPILEAIEPRFSYAGSARDYFLRSLREQVAFSRARFEMLERYFAWSAWTGRRAVAQRELSAHEDVAAMARARRERALEGVARIARLPAGSPILEALRVVPRERFVPLDAIEASTRDEVVPLGDGSAATVSAMHAYAVTVALAGIAPGQRVLDLGSGSGYGTALLAHLVGPTGRVRGVEIDPALVVASREALGARANVEIVEGSALDPQRWAGEHDVVVVGFALPEIPHAALTELPIGCVVVAPVVRESGQRLARIRVDVPLEITWHDEVRYVPARAEVTSASPPREARPLRALPVVREPS